MILVSTGGGKVGIGTDTPTAKLQVAGGGVYVSDSGEGIILKSPNGTVCRLISIDNAGALVTTVVTCP